MKPTRVFLETGSDPAQNRIAARRVLVAFLFTFLFARLLVLLIMARKIPDLFLFVGGTHVHHLNYGIVLLAFVGGYLLFNPGSDRRWICWLYGIGMGLTFDEFGMWLHLGGSYWQRASVDATIVVAALLAFIAYARSIRTFGAKHIRIFCVLAVAVVLFAALLYDTALHVGAAEGQHLRDLEAESSP